MKVISATITFPTTQEATEYSSFHTEMPKTVLKVIENDLMNCCQNEKDLVDYRGWGTSIETVAAKGGLQYIIPPIVRTITLKNKFNDGVERGAGGDSLFILF